MTDYGDVRVFPISPEVAKRLDEADGPDAPVRGVPRIPGACRHERTTLDLASRALTCAECAKVLDPYDWIDRLAREWDVYVYRWKSARVKVRALEKAVADLERKEKNAKARVRNAEHPAAKEARQALRDAAKLLWELLDHFGERSPQGLAIVDASLRAQTAAAALAPQKIAAGA
jgi:hypothetical protein